jgi:hypothetical protein
MCCNIKLTYLPAVQNLLETCRGCIAWDAIGRVLSVLEYQGFEVFTAVSMKNAVFWDVAPCGFIIDRRFGGTCPLHLQGKRNNANDEKCNAITGGLLLLLRGGN